MLHSKQLRRMPQKHTLVHQNTSETHFSISKRVRLTFENTSVCFKTHGDFFFRRRKCDFISENLRKFPAHEFSEVENRKNFLSQNFPVLQY